MYPRRTRLAVAAVTAPLLLVLAACGGDDDLDDSGTVSAPESSASTPAPTTSESGAPTSEAPASSGTAGGALLTAAATGLGAVPSSTVFAVDRTDRGGWEVSVVTPDGTEYDVRVSADGTTIERDPVEDTDTDDGAGEAARDTDERLRLLEVGLDHEAAVEAAAGRGGSELTGVELDEDNGAATWEVAYDEDTADELTVTLDASSGEVLGTERDD